MTEKNNLYLALKEVAAITMNRYTQKYDRAMNLIVREIDNCYILQQWQDSPVRASCHSGEPHYRSL